MSKRHLIATVTVLLLSAAPTIAHAQIERGDSQISLQGSLQTQISEQTDLSTTNGSFGGSYGYYLTRQLALRGVAFLAVSKSNVTGAYGGGIELNLTGADQKFVPYLAFDALALANSSAGQNSSSVQLGPSVGVRTFVSRNTAFNVAMEYRTFSDNMNIGTLETSFGFSFFFGGDRRR